MSRLLACLLCPLALRAAPVVAQAAAAMGASDAVLQPGDKVQVRIWREPDLSGEFVVAEDGMVVFPKVGQVEVRQLSPDSLRSLLTTRYAVSLRDPSIEVTVLRRVSVAGAVHNPGFYYADPTVTVQGAVAMAGGVTQEGNRKKLELSRDGRTTELPLGTGANLADSALHSGDQVRVPERSWVSRNTGLVASMITGAAVVAAAIIRP